MNGDETTNAEQQNRQVYRFRIDALRSSAELDGLEVNEFSVRDFWSFIGSLDLSRQAGLALMDNGNMRAVWKGKDDSHLGLHFLGEQQVQYVIFKQRSGNKRIFRAAGRDSFEGVRRQIGAFDLMPLVST